MRVVSDRQEEKVLPAEMCRLPAALAGPRQPDGAGMGAVKGLPACLHSRAGRCVRGWDSKHLPVPDTWEDCGDSTRKITAMAHDLLLLIEQRPRASPWSRPASCCGESKEPCCISLAGRDLPAALLSHNRLMQQGWDDHIQAVACQAGRFSSSKERRQKGFMPTGHACRQATRCDRLRQR